MKKGDNRGDILHFPKEIFVFCKESRKVMRQMIFQSKPNEKSFAAEKWSEKKGKRPESGGFDPYFFAIKSLYLTVIRTSQDERNGSLTNFLQ